MPYRAGRGEEGGGNEGKKEEEEEEEALNFMRSRPTLHKTAFRELSAHFFILTASSK